MENWTITPSQSAHQIWPKINNYSFLLFYFSRVQYCDELWWTLFILFVCLFILCLFVWVTTFAWVDTETIFGMAVDTDLWPCGPSISTNVIRLRSMWQSQAKVKSRSGSFVGHVVRVWLCGRWPSTERHPCFTWKLVFRNFTLIVSKTKQIYLFNGTHPACFSGRYFCYINLSYQQTFGATFFIN